MGENSTLAPDLQRADDLMMEGRYGQAIRCIRRFLRRYPSDTEALVLLGESLEAQEKHAEALEPVLRVLEQEPEHWRALGKAADLLNMLGRSAEALPLVEQAIRLYEAMPLGEQL